jgi:hypothetical protein
MHNLTTVLSSVFKCVRICVCGMQPVVRKLCGPLYLIFAHIRVDAVNMRVHTVNIRVHAVYNVIVEYFLLFFI